jgi:hypothetical protein
VHSIKYYINILKHIINEIKIKLCASYYINKVILHIYKFIHNFIINLNCIFLHKSHVNYLPKNWKNVKNRGK